MSFSFDLFFLPFSVSSQDVLTKSFFHRYARFDHDPTARDRSTTVWLHGENLFRKKISFGLAIQRLSITFIRGCNKSIDLSPFRNTRGVFNPIGCLSTPVPFSRFRDLLLITN